MPPDPPLTGTKCLLLSSVDKLRATMRHQDDRPGTSNPKVTPMHHTIPE